MSKDKEFTSKNTFYYEPVLIDPNNTFAIKSREAEIEQKAKGRKAILMCRAEFLNGALEIGMNAEQKAIFEKWFGHNAELTKINTYQVKKGKRRVYDIKQMIDAIFDAVYKLKYPHELQYYFLKGIEEDVKSENGFGFEEPKHEFLQMLHQRLKKPICNATEFKTDLSELCGRCPLRQTIPEGIQTQIVAQAEDSRELMPPEQYVKWIEGEINAAAKEMQQMRIDAMNPEQHYLNVLTEHFIWNKERAKALRAILNRKPQDAEPQAEPLPTFKELFFNEANADKVRGLMPPNISYCKSICFAMADVLKEKGYCPKYPKQVVARVLAAEFYGEQFPKYFREKRYRADHFEKYRRRFYRKL